MKHEITAPLVNNNDDEVMVVEWHSTIGQRIEAGDLLVTVATPKAAVEVPSPVPGFLRWTACDPGQSLNVGRVLAVLTDTADESDALPSPVAAPEPARAGSEEKRATLKARALANKAGLSLDLIAPGPDGRITEEDVRRALDQRPMPAPAPAQVKDRPALIVGDSAHARFVRDLAVRSGYRHIVGCVSETEAIGDTVAGMKVLGRDADLPALFASGIAMALIGVGSSRTGIRSNERRVRLFDLVKAAGFSLPVLVDPDASVSESAVLGEGTMVGAGAVVSTGASVGRNVLVNVGAIVCHDCVIGDHVHITPGAILAGSVVVGEGTTIGMGSTLLDGVKVGRNCLILNNARVIRDVEDNAVVKNPGA